MLLVSTVNGYRITTKFLEVDPIHKSPHQGIDLAMTTGTPVPSLNDGIVSFVSDEGAKSFGKSVRIHFDDGVDVIYGHLSKIDVKSGQHIHAGEVIGLSGNTGQSTGEHLHIQLSRYGENIDPLLYLKDHPLALTKDAPWYDIPANVDIALDEAKRWFSNQFDLFTGWVHFEITSFFELAIPTASCIAIFWWMCPFFPKSDKAPKLLGLCLLVYLFYNLIKGVCGV